MKALLARISYSLRQWKLRHFPEYEILEEGPYTYKTADRMLRENSEETVEEKTWALSPKEDNNQIMGLVWLCRRKRIIE